MTNEAEVYFCLRGYKFDPEEVTQAIGLNPTSTSLKGDPIPKYTAWRLSTGKFEADVIDVYEMSASILEDLHPRTDQIVEVKEKHNLEAILQVVLWISTDDEIPTPALGFDTGVIHFLGVIGASIDVDTYRN